MEQHFTDHERLLAEMVCGAALEFSEAEMARAARHFADLVGVMLAAAEERSVGTLAALCQDASGAVRSARIWGTERRVSSRDAGLVNGYAAHWHDYDDDETDVTMAHLTVTAMTAAAVIGDSRPGIPGAAVLQAYLTGSEQKSKPQHVLYDDEALMGKVSGLFRRAFGKDLMFDFRGGSRLPIHVGELPKIEGNVDRVSNAYVQAVRENPLLDQQGDGMKSYAGILFESIVADLDITLIDEPEAFLHPPQMRRLGETLATEVNGQLIVATHSSDIMRGFLEGTRGNVRILRIRRETGKNHVAEAEPEVIRDLWEKPELRYSNALEGVFHEQTIICEDDSDCRLINSIADHLALQSEEQWQDTAYVPTGGKHGVPKIAGVLRQIGVPVKAVFDIDFLSEQSLVQSAVEAFGGQWDEVKPLWTRVDAAVRAGNKPKSVPQIKEELVSLLNGSETDDLPKGDVIEIMKQGKAWNYVKKYGTRGIPNGEAQRDYSSLRDKLEEMGIYLVPVGEIENFCPEIGSHGPKFVTKLLSTIQLGDDRLLDLRSFVERVHKGTHSR